jgi:hypothetical protein
MHRATTSFNQEAGTENCKTVRHKQCCADATNAGMGSLYRSQHELLPLFKNGSAPHVNNIELGKRGHWRSNVWTYPGASSLGSDARRGLKDHPTVKPTAMLEDALLDLYQRRDCRAFG